MPRLPATRPALALLLLLAPAGGEDAAALLERGRAAAAKGDVPAAYAALAGALRAAPGQDLKDQARDALLALPPGTPPPLSAKEREIVVARIDEERARYLREVANRLLDRRKLRGALRILEVVRGSLQEEATARVIGDPKGAERRDREVADLKVRIFGEIPAPEKEEADGIASRFRADPERLLREAARLRKDGKPLAARRALQNLVLDPAAPAGPKEAARAEVASLEKQVLADLDAEERRTVDEALACPVFGRLQTALSREFIYIGDADLVARIPEKSRHLLDLAYVALTDLAGRVPNPEGDRVTIFFKELWDFGGGVGGGKRIDIGRAEPKARTATLVHSGLFFHELSHCVLVPEPRFPGWMEGIANFGAAFCALFLKQEGEAWPSAQGNLDAFRRDYLGREEAYWRTAPYGPTAGWLLHWIDRYGRRPGGGLDWARYGRVLRAWSAAEPPPATVAGTARLFGALLAREFGPGVWDDLREQRFPCEEGSEVDPGLPDGKAHLAGHIARGVLLLEGTEAAERERVAAEGGFLRGWRVAGPFYPPERGDGLATPFAPEREILFDREYPNPRQVARWFAAGPPGGPVSEDGAGLASARWAYPEDSVTYGWTEFETGADADAWAWVTTESRWALWIDGVLVERQEWEAGRLVEDRDRVPLRLGKGRHRALVKVALGWAGPSFGVRITDREGKGIPGFRSLPPGERPYEAAVPEETKPFFRDDFRRASLGSGWTEGPGGFRLRNEEARGTEDRGAVPWRKYSVRPGFPQDSPSNSMTLDPKAARKAGKDLRLEVHLLGSPKIALTLDAEEAPGGLTGWTVVVIPTGGEVDVRLERYDRLQYLVPGVPLGKEKGHVVVVERRRGAVTVTVDGALALDRVSAPPLRRDGLRISTWGPDPALTRVEMRRFE